MTQNEHTEDLPDLEPIDMARTRIKKLGAEKPPGWPLCAQDLCPPCTAMEANGLIERLADEGLIRAIDEPWFVQLRRTRLGPVPPTPEEFAMGMAMRTGETIAAFGPLLANQMGLSTQIPMRTTFLTSGPSRIYTLMRPNLEMRQAPAWLLIEPFTPQGDAIRALAAMGPGHSCAHARQIRRVAAVEQNWEQVMELAGQTPAWMRRALRYADRKGAP